MTCDDDDVVQGDNVVVIVVIVAALSHLRCHIVRHVRTRARALVGFRE